MRAAFIATLADLAAEDPRIVLLTGDLGFMVLERFAQRFPERFINVGVAEQNMAGIATGLAEAGFIPFVYSITPFATLRAYEFIRNGPVQHRLPVRIIGVGGGFDYGHNGFSHYALEDIAAMYAQPGMLVVVPGDDAQAGGLLRGTWDAPRPVYYRLGKDRQPPLVPDAPAAPGAIQMLRAGGGALILALGPMAGEAMAAAEALGREGLDCSVAMVTLLDRDDSAALRAIVLDARVVVTVEAHYAWGGLGTAVAEIMAEVGSGARLRRLGIGTPESRTGSTARLNALHGLDAASIARAVRETAQPAAGA